MVGRVRRLFRWAVSEKLVPSAVIPALESVAPLKNGRSTAREQGPVLPVDDATVERTLPHLPRIVAAMVRIQRLTGARPHEVVQMRPGAFDRSRDVWTYVPTSRETEHRGRTRVIAIGPRAQAVRKPFLERAPDAFCFDPREAVKEHRERQQLERQVIRSGGNGGNRKPKVETPDRPTGGV